MMRMTFASFILLSASFAMARPEVVFPVEAEVSRSNVLRVIEVAELKDFSSEAFSELSQMILSEVKGPTEESAIVLNREELSKKLRDFVSASAVLKKANPSFKIPEKVTLSSAASFSKAATEKALRNILGTKCPDCKYQIQISSAPALKSTSWSIDYTQDIKNGAFMLPIREKDGFAAQWVTGSLHIKKSVPVLKRTLNVGERLQAEDLEMAENDITFLKENPISAAEAVGLIANRSIQPRSVVLLSDFKKEAAAKKGQIVKALVGSDQFEVSINATAEENGSIGDLIKIQNPETKKMMSAVILEKGVVKVQ